MTIGKFDHDYSTGPNPDFISLMKCHNDICEAFALNEADVEVSMGMSDDFEEAVSSFKFTTKCGGIFWSRDASPNSLKALYCTRY